MYKAAVPSESEDIFMLIPFLMFVLIRQIMDPFLTSLVSEFFVVVIQTVYAAHKNCPSPR